MKKIYRSKVDRILLLSPAVIFLASVIYALFGGNFLISIIIVAVLLFFYYLYRTTSYELTKDNKLKVQSGFLFHREIYINSIRKVKPAKDYSASPAFSQDRLQIFYNRYGSLLISPEHKQEFIDELKKINPRINVE